MRNSFKMNVQVTRLELCDLLLACRCAEFSANDGGKKWRKLHDKLREQLNDLDRQIDGIVKFETF